MFTTGETVGLVHWIIDDTTALHCTEYLAYKCAKSDYVSFESASP